MNFESPPGAAAVAESAGRRPAPAPPRLYYGWVMVALTTLVLVASSPGQTYGFTYFNPQLRGALGLSQTEISALYLLATLLAAVPLSYLGAVIDRVGLKRSVLATNAAMGAACLLAATVQNVPMLFGACVSLRLFGPGLMTLLSNNTLAAWFDHRLGLASGYVQLAMAATVAIAPLGIMGMIAACGWRGAYLALGAALLAGVLPLLWWAYHDDPADVGQQRDGDVDGPNPGAGSLAGSRAALLAIPADEDALDLAGAMRTRAFWILMAATSVWSMIGTGLIFHLESLLASRGLAGHDAAWATPAMAICMAVTQLAGGRLADRLPPGRLAAAALALVAGACGAFALGRGQTLIAAYGAYGLGQGLMSLVSTTVWARFFGRTHLGRIRGTALSAAISSSAVGPLVMGASVDFLGGFEPSMWVFAAGALMVAGIAPWATSPWAPRREASDPPSAAAWAEHSRHAARAGGAQAPARFEFEAAGAARLPTAA